MKPRQFALRLLQFALMSLVSAVLTSQAAHADEEILKLKYAGPVKAFEFSKQLKVRGFQVGEGVYMGQAKVAGKYGLGVVVDRDTYSWGVNYRGISILKRF